MADILQIRDYQRPEEATACDKRLNTNIPTIYITESEVDAIAKYADFRDQLQAAAHRPMMVEAHNEFGVLTDLTQAIADIPSDYDPRKPA